MSNNMTTADVPVHLGEAITMEIQFLKEIIDDVRIIGAVNL